MSSAIAANILSGNPGSRIMAPDVFNARTPNKSKALGYLKAMAMLRGDVYGVHGMEAINAANYIAKVTGTTPTVTTTDGLPPTLLVTTTAADNEGGGFYFTKDRGTTHWDPFVPTGAYPIFFETRLRLTAAASPLAAVAAIGIGKYYNGDPFDSSSVVQVTDGIYFLSTVTTGALSLVVKAAAGSSTVTALSVSLTADTYTTLGFRINGRTSIDWWCGRKSGKITTMTNLPATTINQTLFGGVHAKAAAVKKLEISRIACLQEYL